MTALTETQENLKFNLASARAGDSVLRKCREHADDSWFKFEVDFSKATLHDVMLNTVEGYFPINVEKHLRMAHPRRKDVDYSLFDAEIASLKTKQEAEDLKMYKFWLKIEQYAREDRLSELNIPLIGETYV